MKLQMLGARLGHRRLAVAAVALAWGVSACDSESSGPPPTGLELHLYASPSAANPFDGVAFIRLLMEGDGLLQPYTQVTAYQPGGQVSLDGVPFSKNGEARQLVIEGWTANALGQPSALVSRGRSLPVEVLAGREVQAFDVLFARVNTFMSAVSSNSLTPQQLVEGRVGHTATPTDAHEIVIAGGGSLSAAGAAWWRGGDFDQVRTTVESFDLRTHELTTRSPMMIGRAWHTATPLGSGQVIFAGGYNQNGDPLVDVELYNPPGVLDGTAKPLPALAVARAGHTATVIDETTRTILFVGGDANGTWELWDPLAGSQGVHPLTGSEPRRHHCATVFYVAGRIEPAVLITGGESDTSPHATAMLYDSVAQDMVAVGQLMPSGPRTQHTATLVPERNFIYVAGGYTAIDRSAATGGIDVFDIGKVGFLLGQEGFRMRTARGGHAAALGPNNTVVYAGGSGSEPAGAAVRALSSIEVVYEYVDAVNGTLNIEVASSWNPVATASVVPYMPQERVGVRAVALGNGMTLMIGGASQSTGAYSMIRELSVYNPL